MIFLTLFKYENEIPITSQNAPFFIFIFAVGLILFFWFWKFCISYYRRKFRELSDFFEGKIVSKWTDAGYRFVGVYKKTNFAIEYLPGENAFLEIQMESQLEFSLTITKETMITKFAKTIGLDKEIEIGNTFFDSEFHVFTKYPEFAQKYLSSMDVQKNIKDIFDAGFSMFKITKPGRTIPGTIRIIKHDPYLKEDFKREKLLMVMEAVYLLSQITEK